MLKIRAEETDPETLFLKLSNLENDEMDDNCENAVIAMSGIVAEQERRIKRLMQKVCSMAVAIKHLEEKVNNHETRIIDMGFPT